MGAVELADAPVVDDSSGPGRGQTICDLRSRRMGFPSQPGAHCRVVLSLGEDFAPHLMERLLAPSSARG